VNHSSTLHSLPLFGIDQSLINTNQSSNIFKFPSDISLSQNPATASAWQHFASASTAQEDWDEDFARAYVRLSLLGVNNINQLTDCTKVLPSEIGGGDGDD
jgi:hypothetical protein